MRRHTAKSGTAGPTCHLHPSPSSSDGGSHMEALPCTTISAHGKERFTVQDVAVYSSPCVAHGKVFAVCFPAFAVCRGALP